MLQAEELDLSCLNSRSGSPSGYYDDELEEQPPAPPQHRMAQAHETELCAQGDVGISVVVEMGPAGVLLRISSYDADSPAEASGEIRRGDVVVSVDGEDLTGSDVLIQGFNQAVRGPVGSQVSLCLMDPRLMEPRIVQMPRSPMGITPAQVFEQRYEVLKNNLLGQASGKGVNNLLEQSLMLLRKSSEITPNIALVGAGSHGKTTLIQSIFSSLNDVVSAEPPSMLERGSHRILDEVFQGRPIDQQPFTLIDTLALEEQGSAGGQKTYLRQIVKGIYGELQTPRPRDPSKRSFSPNVHAVVLVLDATMDEPNTGLFQTVAEVCREQDNTPLILAVTKVDQALQQHKDVLRLVQAAAKILPKASFFPTTVVSP